MTTFIDPVHAGYPDGFVDDPVVSHSAQFGLARPVDEPAGTARPSPAGIRPWGLRSAAALPATGPQINGWSYDHAEQIAVTAAGPPPPHTVVAAPTATSVSQLDGDEGPNEDWSYDFCPDQPGEPW